MTDQLLTPNELVILRDHDESLKLAVVKMHLTEFMNCIHREHGHRFFELSRQTSRKTEKTWFLISIELENWQQRLNTKQLDYRCLFSTATWHFETTPILLEMLYNMDPETGYMLAAEIYDTSRGSLEFSVNMVFEPSPVPDAPCTPRGYTLVQHMITAPSGELLTKICMRCKTVNADLKVCQGCLLVPYCSVTCQRADWPIHKDNCKLLRKLNEQRALSLPD